MEWLIIRYYANPTRNTPQSSPKPSTEESPAAKLRKIVAILESLRADGEACEHILKLDRTRLRDCYVFMLRAGGTDGDFPQAARAAQELAASTDTQFVRDHATEILRMKHLAQEIPGYATFVAETARAQSR